MQFTRDGSLRENCQRTNSAFAESESAASFPRQLARFDQIHADVYSDQAQLDEHRESCVFRPADFIRPRDTANRKRDKSILSLVATHFACGFMRTCTAKKPMLTTRATRTRACSDSSPMSTTHPAAKSAIESKTQQLQRAEGREPWRASMLFGSTPAGVLSVSLRHMSRGSHQKALVS